MAFAQIGLRAMFILNGGAMVLLPAYILALDLPLDFSTDDIIASAIAYAAGLVLAAAATFAAYGAMILRGRRAARRLRDGLSRDLREDYAAAPVQASETVSATALQPDPGAPRLQNAAPTKSRAASEICRLAAIAATLLSLAAFIGGSYFAARAMFEGAAEANQSSYGA